MAGLELTKKLLIYHTLYRLNLSFSHIVKEMCHIAGSGNLQSERHPALPRTHPQELQCEINELILENMHNIEFNDWGRFGKIRKAEEKRLRYPDDMFLQAEERRRELRKKSKKK